MTNRTCSRQPRSRSSSTSTLQLSLHELTLILGNGTDDWNQHDAVRVALSLDSSSQTVLPISTAPFTSRPTLPCAASNSRYSPAYEPRRDARFHRRGARHVHRRVVGCPRAPAVARNLAGYHAGRAPGNKGRRYPADPPTVEEIVAVMRQAGVAVDGRRAQALIVVLWRAGLRISEALALNETDLDPNAGPSWCAAAEAASAAPSAWTPGAGNRSAHGLKTDSPSRPARCSASSTGRPPAGHARRHRSARSSDGWPSTPGCGAGSSRNQLRHAHAVERPTKASR